MTSGGVFRRYADVAHRSRLRSRAFPTSPGTPPDAVDDLACAQNGADIDLTWTAPNQGSSAITDYYVYVGQAQAFD